MSKNKTPNLATEAIVVAIKLFFIFLVLNNLAWAVIHFRQPPMTITQTDNHDITQSIN